MEISFVNRFVARENFPNVNQIGPQEPEQGCKTHHSCCPGDRSSPSRRLAAFGEKQFNLTFRIVEV